MKKLIVTLRDPKVIEAIEAVQPRFRGFLVELALSNFLRTETGKQLFKALMLRSEGKKDKLSNSSSGQAVGSWKEKLKGDLY